MKKNKIKNWSIFGVDRIGISIIKHETDNGIFYNPHITFFLDEGKKIKNVEDAKCITLINDLYMSCPRRLTATILDMYNTLYEDVEFMANIIMFDTEMNEIGIFDIDEYLDGYELDDYFSSNEQTPAPTLH